MLELKPSRVVKIKFEGEEYSASPIKLGDQILLENELESAQEKGTGGSELTMKLLVKCGLPESMIKKLDAEQLLVVVDALKPSKKN